MNDLDKSRIYELYKQGVSLKEMAITTENDVASVNWVIVSAKKKGILENRKVSISKQGTLHNVAKLTENQVKEIILFNIKGSNFDVLAKKFGVSKDTIRKICQRKTWKHLNTDFSEYSAYTGNLITEKISLKLDELPDTTELKPYYKPFLTEEIKVRLLNLKNSPKKTPRTDQIEAINKAVSHYKDNERGQMVVACGVGKTLTSLWISEKLSAQNIVVAIPSLQLQAQSVASWIAEAQAFDYEMLVIGSDYSIENLYGVKVSTNVDEISAFLSLDCKKIVFTTYHSTIAFSDACVATNFEFDFGIIDESHRTAGHDTKVFSRILFDENGIVIKKRLFMTATPKFFYDNNLISMDDVSIYGKVFYRITTEQAIEKGILSDYKLLVIWLDDDKLLKFSNTNRISKYKNLEVPNKYFSLVEFVEKAIVKYGMRKIVSFHKSVDFAKSFDIVFKENQSKVQSFHLNNKIKVTERYRILAQYKEAETSIITNPRILMEGYDLPEIDGVLFADLKKNQSDTTQAIGRCLRRHKGKNMGYVLFPIFVNSKGVVNKKEFDYATQALSNIVATDTRLISYFSTNKKSDKKESDLIENVVSVSNAASLNFDFKSLQESISIRVWNRTKVLQYLSWDEFNVFIKENCPKIGVNTKAKYLEWVRGEKAYEIKAPSFLTPSPEGYYAENWEGWDVLFGKRGKNDIMSFDEARTIAHEVCEKHGVCSAHKIYLWKTGQLENAPEFPVRFPISPDKSYKGLFTTWADFFGKETEEREYMTYEDAKKWVRAKGITKRTQFYEAEKPKNISSNPQRLYKDEWQGWDEFFGKKKSKKIDFLPYIEAKKWVHDTILPHGIDSFNKWFAYRRGEFPNLPKCPNGIRSSLNLYPEFEGWDVFFGKEKYYKNQ